jgi:hypothetical protein
VIANNQEAIDLLLRRLGRRTDPDLRTDTINELNIAKQSLEINPFHPWFLYQTLTLTIPLNASRIDLPSGFLGEDEEAEALVFDQEAGADFPIYKRRREDIDLLGREPSTAGRPQRYTVSETGIYFFPKAEKAYLLKFPCAVKTNDIVDTTAELNPWIREAPNLILNLAGAVIAGLHVQNAGLEQRMIGLASASRQTLINYHEARLATNVDSSNSDLMADRTERV